MVAGGDGTFFCPALPPEPPPTWCVDGAACTPPSNQCHAGTLSCATMTCVDTGNPVTDGTACSSGTCTAGVCSEVCSGPFASSDEDCAAGPCQFGGCQQNLNASTGTCQPSPETIPNGTSCGANVHRICESGACTVASCVTDDDCAAGYRCAAPAAPCPAFPTTQSCSAFTFQCVYSPCNSHGVMAARGTPCGPAGAGFVCNPASLCDPQLGVTVSSQTFSPGVAFSGTVGTVADLVPGDTAASLMATIDWGDGTTSAGTLSGTTSPFTVTGSHTYAASGSVIVTVTVTDASLGSSGNGAAIASVGATLVSEITVPNGASSIATGSDGALWFIESQSGNIGRITTGGAFTEFTTTFAGSPSNIVAGPDGALWLIVANTNAIPATYQIGRVTTAGSFSFFNVPTTASSVAGLAAGSDGNVWFTEETKDIVGRVTPAGAITEFPLGGASGDDPTAITSGPDGALWFVLGGKDAIGRITTSGSVSSFAIPTCAFYGTDDFPAGIAAGPDGNLWFTESSEGRDHTFVGRLTTAGAFTTFALPLAQANPGAMTAGTDGKLWFIDAQSETVDSVTTSGVFGAYTLPTSTATLGGITLGPDGHIWFAEISGPGVGRVTAP